MPSPPSGSPEESPAMPKNKTLQFCVSMIDNLHSELFLADVVTGALFGE